MIFNCTFPLPFGEVLFSPAAGDAFGVNATKWRRHAKRAACGGPVKDARIIL